MRAQLALMFVLLVTATACLGPQEDPTNINDLRVIGMAFDPPEIMSPVCSVQSPITAFTFARPVTFSALILDPAGEGRTFDYEIKACASTGDRTCNNDNDYTIIKVGKTSAGELKETLTLGTQFLPDNSPLLQAVVEQDRYQGLGGIRIPVVLHLKTDTGEEIYAQKLMVFSCRLYPQMVANKVPVLPGMTTEGQTWEANDVREFNGRSGVDLLPTDFTDLQESYIVPSLSLKPLELTESWKVSWYASVGTMGGLDTGGTDFSGGSSAHRNKWSPDSTLTEPTDVNFWFVVRDGRGGSSWITRRAHWTP